MKFIVSLKKTNLIKSTNMKLKDQYFASINFNINYNTEIIYYI